MPHIYVIIFKWMVFLSKGILILKIISKIGFCLCPINLEILEGVCS